MERVHDEQSPQHDRFSDTETTRREFLVRSLAALGGVVALSLVGSDNAHGGTKVPDFGKPNGPDDRAYWASVRAQFQFEPGYTYLNNGGLGVPPKPVMEAVSEGYQRFSALGDEAENDVEMQIENKVRPSLAQFVGADPDEIALTRNATEGLNTIVNGIEMKPGDEVLTTTHEHPGGLNPWMLKGKRYGVIVRKIRIPSPPASAEAVVDLFRRAITPRTRVLFFCHISRGPGLLYPAKALCALARERGIISAVDGAQSVGMMPVNLHEMGCDLFATSLHKWLLSPIGTGMLYVRKGVQKDFWPLTAGSGPWDQADAGAWRYESIGTYEMPLRAAIGTALEFFKRIGIDNIATRNRMLSDYLKTELAKLPKVRLATSTSPELSSPGITSLEVQGWDATMLNSALQEEYRIRTSRDRLDDNNLLRISTHFYNTTEEVDEVVAALKTLIPMA